MNKMGMLLLAAVGLGGQAGAAEVPVPVERARIPIVFSGAADQTTATEKPAAAATPAEQALRTRVRQRWDALMGRRYDEVYGFTTPAYRKIFSKAHYLGHYAEQVKRTGIEIHKVEFQDAEQTRARVRVVILFETEVAGRVIHGRSPIWENWIKEEGEWWLVPEQR